MASGSSSSAGKVLKRANSSTIQDKFLVGYQGWFTCAGDGEPIGPGHHGWLHWFNHPIPDGGRPNTDFWPDVSAYSPSELFPAPGLKTKSGEQTFLFSSRNAKTVQRHFHWMAEHGVDGAFLQRFAGQCDLENGNEGIRRLRDEVGDRVREAAEREGRVFAIMYDVSSVPANKIQRILQHDWNHLVRNKGVLDSPNYLKERGKPVIALWGFGFEHAGHTPELVRSIVQFFRQSTPGGVYVMGGAPSCWRLSEGDADRHSDFVNMWLNEFDAISPWTIGRYKDEQEADAFAESKMKGDVELIKKRNEETGRRVDYIPVVLPGGSGYNLSEGKWDLNGIKRRGGRFLWRQISNAKRLGVRTMYGAMWDEYDEGTAFMPIVEHKRNLPHSDKFPFLALDEDGYDVPSDWYMRICGFAAEGLRSERRIHETFPVKELQDYWSSRPKYEEVSAKSGDWVSGSSMVAGGASGSGSSGGDDGQTYEEWLASQKDNKDEAPPPPYTLESEEPEPERASAAPAAPVPTQQPAQVQPIVPDTPAIVPTMVPQQPSSVAPHASPVGVVSNAPMATAQPPTSPISPSHPGPYGSHAHGVPPVVNANSYPAYGGGPQPGSGVGTPVQAYPPVAGPAGASGFPYQQQQPTADPVGALTQDFGRHNISGLGVGGGRISNASPPPPIHPAHPTATRPQNVNSRPTSAPQSQAAYHPVPPSQNSTVPPSGAAPAASGTTVWPPPEWGVAANAPPATNHSTYPGQLSNQPPAHGPGVSGSCGGANLTRPQTFSASSYNGGANLRPHASLSAHGRPPRPSTSNSNPTTPSASAGYPPAPSGYPGSSMPSSPTAFGGSPYPQPSSPSYAPSAGHPSYASPTGPTSYHPPSGSSSYTPTTAPSSYTPTSGSSYTPTPTAGRPQMHGHGNTQSHGGPGFPGVPTPSTYTPPASTYPGQTGSTYPGQQGGPSFNLPSQPPHGSSHNWASGTSPPQSPPLPGGGPSAFPSASTPPYNPAYIPSGGPSFPSNHGPSSTSPAPENGSPHLGPGGPQFPGTGYFGSGSTMPGPDNGSSPYPSAYPGQYGSPASAYPGHGGSSFPQASPWGGPSSSTGPPLMPPRPQSSGYGKPPSGPTFPMASTTGSNAFNYALTAVDKVAGRKTKEQIESLAQSGSKLYSKFMK